ncbi:hypothetical protein DQ010_17805 [Salmonella enterica subsp. enterica serovar Oranienburg]|nr:hypothetical protein [Salmonella enterica subsp. enterica serovar Kisangani]EAU2346127.1 hypothetical protein [Salmonella enterica]EBV5176618.1 hypothetical protein [Salmonella enterica subsp. enterica serovar Carmel]EBX1066002.1 hypothetical protein [Salmonella enterica subsp. enterica serovar Oranienburg]ECA2178773.1 hypothetical protein [Salmonella enterica subsp. enterica serovar Kisangani]
MTQSPGSVTFIYASSYSELAVPVWPGQAPPERYDGGVYKPCDQAYKPGDFTPVYPELFYIHTLYELFWRYVRPFTTIIHFSFQPAEAPCT